MKADKLPPDPRIRLAALGAFALIAAILMGLGYWHYLSEKEDITREQYHTLAAIGELKARQIRQWRKERKAEIERAAKDTLMRKTISDVLNHPGDQNLRKELQDCLRDEVTGQDNSAALVFDTRENLLASTDEAAGQLDSATQKAMREAIAGNTSVVSDLYRSLNDVIHIDLAAPVPDDNGHPQGVLILRHEAQRYLYPLIQEWPTPSRSAETIMVKRDGNEVVFLNDLRHGNGPPLSQRHPLTDKQLPAVQAVLGKEGIFKGVDDRGVEVVSALLAVPDSPWFITAEVEAREILADAYYRAGAISLIVGLLILLAAGSVAFFYRRRQAGILNTLVKAEQQKLEAQERAWQIGQHYQTILQTAMDGFWLVDAEGRIREVNEAFCRMTGYSEQELLTMSISDLESPESRAEASQRIQSIIAQGQDRFESRYRHKNGKLIDVEVSVQFKPTEGVMAAFVRDITERTKVDEERIEHTRQLRKSYDRYDELVRQIPVGIYAMHMCADGSAKFEYVSEKLCRMLECDKEEALRDIERVFCTIHPDDRASLDQSNRVAMQTLGLFRWEGRCRLWGKMGWVHIESEPTLLPDGDVLWNGVVSDITGRKHAEAALHESEDRFSRLFRSMDEGFFLAELIYDPAGNPVDWRFLDVNPAYSKIMGLQPKEVIGRSVRELFPGLEDFWFEAHTRCALTGEPATVEGFVQATGRHYINHLHSPSRGQFACIFTDITEEKMAEMALRASEEQFRSMFETASIGMAQADPNTGKFLRVNQKMCMITGYSSDELLHLSVSELTHPDDRQTDTGEFRRVVRGDSSSYRMEKRYVRKDGTEVWVNVNMTVIRDAAGKPVRTMATIEDISARKAAEETSNRLAAIVTSSDDAIISKDLDGFVTTWNHGAEKIFGYTASEMSGASILRLIPPDRQQEQIEILATIRSGGSIEHFETFRQAKDGRLLNVSITSSPIRNDNGTVIGISEVARDITARKQAEACRKIGSEILQGLLRSEDLQTSVQRIVTCLKNGTGLDAAGIRLEDGEDYPYIAQEGFPTGFLLTENSLAARVAGGGLCRDKDGKVSLECTCGLVISGKTDQANPLFTRGGSCWTNDSLSQTGLPAHEDRRLHPRNQCIHYGYASVALIPIRTQERIMGLIQLNDRRKGRFTLETVEILEGIAGYVGEALMRKKADLERKEALLRAEASAAVKSEFLGVMSHELRTPLNGVLGFAELLADTPLNDEQKSFTKTIRKSGEHLLAIVNDVLDFSAMEKGSLSIHCEQFAIAELVKSSEQAIRKTATDKGVPFHSVIEPGVPDRISGDEQRIRQILINLLGNAVKFTTDGSVTVRVAVADVEGGQSLNFSVEDTGIGMSPETIGVLFQPFTQAEMKMSRSFGGTGLGLAISQRLAEAMGGKITVSSTQGKGSTFTFRLPLVVPGTQKTLPASPPGVPFSPASVGGSVLVVDDDNSSCVVAVKMLQSLGYHAEAVSNGAEAVEAFVPGKYSYILMDMAMPVMDGLVATKKIRGIEAASECHVRIIAFTANVMPGDRERCLAASMDDFLAKPFKRDELAAKLSVFAHS